MATQPKKCTHSNFKESGRFQLVKCSGTKTGRRLIPVFLCLDCRRLFTSNSFKHKIETKGA